MSDLKPFIKWAGGKRWLADREDFKLPAFSGRYIEPFLGGAAMFFHLRPSEALLSDVNPRLIDTYNAVADDYQAVVDRLIAYQTSHSSDFYYEERGRVFENAADRAAQFLYLNRTCWNGLYRENLSGVFNVPIGTKSNVYDAKEDFKAIAETLSAAKLSCCDFEETIDKATAGDLLFIDPPYTTAHNFNGFVKYNQKIFRWEDQERLLQVALRAKSRGAKVVITNAQHESILDLYDEATEIKILDRRSVISGLSAGRRATAELLIHL